MPNSMNGSTGNAGEYFVAETIKRSHRNWLNTPGKVRKCSQNGKKTVLIYQPDYYKINAVLQKRGNDMFKDGSETMMAHEAILDMPDIDDDEKSIIDYITGLDELSLFRDRVCARAKELGFSESGDKLPGFILSLCEKHGMNISRQTLNNWLTKAPPQSDDNGRDNVYKLCFALGYNAEQTAEFFLKAFLQKPFNFKNIKESVYCFCLKNSRSYMHALDIIDRINSLRSDEEDIEDDTAAIGRAVMSFTDEEKLIRYLSENKAGFSVQSRTAAEEIKRLITSGKELASQLKAKDVQTEKAATNSTDALLDFIYGYDTADIQSQLKTSAFPKSVRQNFPTKIQISNIINGKGSFDSIRKALIILDFFCFYAEAQLQGITEYTDLSEEFLTELNELLEKCGYIQFYRRNPFDCMISYCILATDPIETLRTIVIDFCEPDGYEL